MTTASYSEIQEYAIGKLTAGLSEKFTYHDVQHTLNVLEQAQVISNLEGVTSAEDVLLVKVSALYHDMGFLDTYQGHEERSCEIAKEDLSRFGFSAGQLNVVFGMIKATQVPQRPKTLLEKIMCDADLDYLGRNDFYEIGAGLYQEFLWQGLVKNPLEWNKVQVRFLEGHRYFTVSSQTRREKQKQEHLAQVKAKVLQMEMSL